MHVVCVDKHWRRARRQQLDLLVVFIPATELAFRWRILHFQSAFFYISLHSPSDVIHSVCKMWATHRERSFRSSNNLIIRIGNGKFIRFIAWTDKTKFSYFFGGVSLAFVCKSRRRVIKSSPYLFSHFFTWKSTRLFRFVSTKNIRPFDASNINLFRLCLNQIFVSINLFFSVELTVIRFTKEPHKAFACPNINVKSHNGSNRVPIKVFVREAAKQQNALSMKR